MKLEQIKKNLLNKDLNMKRLSEKTGISRSNIYDLRNGVRDFDNLTVKTIKSLDHYFEFNKPVFKFKIKEEVEVLVIEDKTSKKVIKLSPFDENVFLEEVAYNGSLLIISSMNKHERRRYYAVKTIELLKNSKALTRKKSNENWHVASVEELKDAGLNLY